MDDRLQYRRFISRLPALKVQREGSRTCKHNTAGKCTGTVFDVLVWIILPQPRATTPWHRAL